MGLPKVGTKVEDLKCTKCGKTLGQVAQEGPQGLVSCEQEDCPQKPLVPGQ